MYNILYVVRSFKWRLEPSQELFYCKLDTTICRSECSEVLFFIEEPHVLQLLQLISELLFKWNTTSLLWKWRHVSTRLLLLLLLMRRRRRIEERHAHGRRRHTTVTTSTTTSTTSAHHLGSHSHVFRAEGHANKVRVREHCAHERVSVQHCLHLGVRLHH